MLEMLLVVTIMCILMVIAVPAFMDIGRGTGIKSTVNNFRATAGSARQYAITKHAKVYFVYGNTNMAAQQTGYFFFATNSSIPPAISYSLVGPTNYSVNGVLFGTEANPPAILSSQPAPIVFDSDGSCVRDSSWTGVGGQFKRRIVFAEATRNGLSLRPSGLISTTEVYSLTGRVRGSGWVDE
jgi:Tfp pilus assembly protein FimT